MDAASIIDLIPTLGFPIVCVIALGFFVLYLYKTNTQTQKDWMAKVEAQTEKREEKLYTEIAECREINKKAIETIAVYAEKLDSIQKDVGDIKTDITIMKAKVED